MYTALGFEVTHLVRNGKVENEKVPGEECFQVQSLNGNSIEKMVKWCAMMMRNHGTSLFTYWPGWF